MNEGQPLLMSAVSHKFRRVQPWVPLAGPVLLTVGSSLIVWALFQCPWPATQVFPLFVPLTLLLYLTAGLGWAFAVVALGSLTGLMGHFFSPADHARLLFPMHAALLGALFWVLSRFDRRRAAVWNRFQEEWDGLELDMNYIEAEVEKAHAAIVDNQARVGAFHRLQTFTDDLVGPCHREELLQRALTGLAGMCPRSRATLHLFPKPDAPDPRDEWGMKLLQWGQARLLPSRSSLTPTWGPGLFMCLPVKGRDSFLGWIGLEAKTPDRPFHIHDLRLASIASDLVSLALGNTDRFTQTEALAITDDLTGLYTRGYLNERLVEELARARHNRRPFSMALVDIDHFKKVNDAHGHQTGDEVLRWLARLLTAQARETDFVARFGGEEFVILMPSTRGGDALRFTQRVCRAVASTPFRWGTSRIRVTLSGGVAALTDDVRNDEELLRRADEALYQAKHAGRNRVCSYAV